MQGIKPILALLLFTSLQAENYLMLSGIAYHNKKENSVGRKYDVVIEGIGYQYRHDCMALECSYTALLINDSNSNPQPIVSFGLAYNVAYNINVGIEAGATNRKRPKSETRAYYPLLLPKVEVDFDWLMLNVTYIPELEYSPSVVYANVGIKF